MPFSTLFPKIEVYTSIGGIYMDERRVLAHNVKTYRLLSGLSLEQFANRLKIGKSTLQNIEAGTGNPRLETLAVMADSLGVPLTQLFSQLPTPEIPPHDRAFPFMLSICCMPEAVRQQIFDLMSQLNDLLTPNQKGLYLLGGES